MFAPHFPALQRLLMCRTARELSSDTLLLLMGCLAASTRQACLRLSDAAVGSQDRESTPSTLMANMHTAQTVKVRTCSCLIG
jgi:hypothetical protein